jgi:hypothetical protein
VSRYVASHVAHKLIMAMAILCVPFAGMSLLALSEGGKAFCAIHKAAEVVD